MKPITNQFCASILRKSRRQSRGWGTKLQSHRSKSLLLLKSLIWPFLLTGCMTTPSNVTQANRINPFTQFYRADPQNSTISLAPWSGQTSIYKTSNFKEDIKKLNQQGYWAMGESAFQGPGMITQETLLAHAEKVGADIVLYQIADLGEQLTSAPSLQYIPGQISTTANSGTVNFWGSGLGSYRGTSTTTTPGTFSTQMVPITLHHYSHDAVFIRKRKPLVFGAGVEALSNDLRTKLQRNTGVMVTLVADESPAFLANILEGDVILKIAGEEVISPRDYIEKTNKLAGQKIDFEVWRNGETKIVPVRLNSIEISPPGQAK